MSNAALSKQVYLYSLDTSDFYDEEETMVSEKYFKSIKISKRLREKKQEYILEFENLSVNDEKYSKIKQKLTILDKNLKKMNGIIDDFKSNLDELLNKNKNIRSLKVESLNPNKAISLFDSTLIRTMKLDYGVITDELFVVRVFHYPVMNNILTNGFMYNGEHYQYYTSSAGQIRTKKQVYIKTSTIDKHRNTLMCGLTVDEINKRGGINTNKYQAYLALTSSASMEWKRFNIDRCIVVDDFTTALKNREVDYIDRDTFEITRKKMDVEIEHMDGCGLVLPSVSKKSFMFRMPWFKGLLVPFDFKAFATEYGVSKVTDVYGKEWDIIEDRINIIFTKSQFKLWKYYDDWLQYQKYFKTYNCKGAKLNIESIGEDANLNYQMLQTLPSMTESELRDIASRTISDINKIGSDKDTMLRLLGATKQNTNKSAWQKALLHAPELLNDTHSKETIKSKKKSLVKSAKAGKLTISGKYTYVIPDLFAFCEWLFLGIEVPNGLLKNGECSCKIYDDSTELDLLRSPHLYREHCIRQNTKNDSTDKWFITKGCYVSSHDLISKELMLDWDGDTVLVTDDKTLIKVAKREMIADDIVPLEYDMEKAPATDLTSCRINEALKVGYKSNIGIIANDISKVWNAEKPNLKVVQYLTMHSNFTIDHAKTLFNITFTDEVDKLIKSFTKQKLPHFFIYAKDKAEHQVEELNNSTVNKLEYIIKDKRISFKVAGGVLNFRDMINRRVQYEVNMDVVDRFKYLSKGKFSRISDSKDNNGEFMVNDLIRADMLKDFPDEQSTINTLVEVYYKKDWNKSTLWDVYGEEIYKNLMTNIGDTIQCENCNKRVQKINETSIYCEPCGKSIKKASKLAWWHRNN